MDLTHLKELFTADLKRIDYGRTALLVLLILAVFSSLWQYAMPQVRIFNTTDFRRVKEIRTVEKVKRVYVPCPEKGIVVLDRQDVAKQLDISWLQGGDIAAAKALEEVTSPSPEGTQTSTPTGTLDLTDHSPGAVIPQGKLPDLQITATADLPESDNGYEGVSVINMTTGESEIRVREKAPPWWQWRNAGAIGINYDLNQHLQNEWNVYMRWEFLRVKNIYPNLHSSFENNGDGRVGVGGEWRW